MALGLPNPRKAKTMGNVFNVFLPPIGAYVRVVWWDNVTAVGTVEDHALDNSGFDLGFTYAELADLKSVTVLDENGTIPRTIDMGIIKIS